MAKRKYYVSVQDGTIMYNQGDAAYELEIEATEEDIAKLKTLFHARENADDHSYFRHHVPGIPLHFDEENDAYDFYNKNIYAIIYELGTDETKKHIEMSGIKNYINEPSAEW